MNGEKSPVTESSVSCPQIAGHSLERLLLSQPRQSNHNIFCLERIKPNRLICSLLAVGRKVPGTQLVILQTLCRCFV